MNYSTAHATALARVQPPVGAAANVTRVVPGTYDPATDRSTGDTMATLAGYAIDVPGNPDTYRALSLVQSSAPSLFWVPLTYGDLPKPGDTMQWRGATMTVKDVTALAPDGVAIAATIIVAGGGA